MSNSQCDDYILEKRILKLASEAGIAQSGIKLYDTLFGLDSQIKEVDVSIEYGECKDNRGVVLFPNSEQTIKHAYRYSILASAFKLRGFQPIFALGHGRLAASILGNPGDNYDISTIEYKEYKTKKILDKFDHKWFWITDYSESRNNSIESSKVLEGGTYRGIDIEGLARASTRKCVKKYHVNDNQDIYDSFVDSGVLLTDIYHDIVGEYNPKIVIGNDDKYNYGGVPLRVASNSGAFAYSSSVGWRDESLIFANIDHRDSRPQFEKAETVESFIDGQLPDSERRAIGDFMDDRVSKNEKHEMYESSPRILSDINSENTTIGVFTNLIWDGSLEVENCPYPDVFNWLKETIHHLRQQDNIKIIIKTHPAEKQAGTNEPVADWIHDNIEYSNNLRILEPDTEVHTYKFINQIDASVVYNSTVGIESVYMGTPAITAGETHYRDLGISIDPETKQEYRDILSEVKCINITKERVNRARRYLYFLFIKKHIPFQYVSQSSDGLKPVHSNEINKGIEEFDNIVDSCSKGSPVLNKRSTLL